MNEPELKSLLSYLASGDLRPGLIVAAIALFLILLLTVYLVLWKRRKGAAIAYEKPEASPKPKAPHNEMAAQAARAELSEVPSNPPRAPAAAIPVHAPRASVAKPPGHSIPQDSVLRRHYMSHIQYMIEMVTFPRPTDSVLRRHYEQLIASELEACLNDEARLEKLISRYEEHRRTMKS